MIKCTYEHIIHDHGQTYTLVILLVQFALNHGLMVQSNKPISFQSLAGFTTSKNAKLSVGQRFIVGHKQHILCLLTATSSLGKIREIVIIVE